MKGALIIRIGFCWGGFLILIIVFLIANSRGLGLGDWGIRGSVFPGRVAADRMQKGDQWKSTF